MIALMAALITSLGAMSFPHYSLVPKDFDANLSFRQDMLQMAGTDPKAAAEMRQMCAEDLLFYINAFCWTYDPRRNDCPQLPFITYEDFQDEAFAVMADSIVRGYDTSWPKSRCMGASWIGLTTYEWFWHFREMMSFLLISRTEDYVDERGNPKSLFWKIDYLHSNQPKWLLPTGRHMGYKDPHRKKLHLGNADNGSVIDGESTTGDAGRGDRRSGMFIDEHAAFDENDGFRVLRASRDTTKSRAFNSTPQGSANAFYEVVHKGGTKVMRLHWSKHPEYNWGLYTSKRPQGASDKAPHELEILTPFQGTILVRRQEWEEPKMLKFPDEYPFILDGKLRSPWYDNECARCVSEMEVAQELDIDFMGSERQYFSPSMIEILIKRHAIPPLRIGDLLFDRDDYTPHGFQDEDKGPLQLWIQPGRDDVLPADLQCVLGIDISAGTGASNSAGCAYNSRTGEKLAVWKHSETPPMEFAFIMVALAKWFNNAYMIWDASGPTGKTFTKAIIEKTTYRNIFYRRSEDKMSQRVSDAPGVFLKGDERAILLGGYRQALGDGTIINRSKEGLQECLRFVHKPGAIPEHTGSSSTQDPTGARSAHGDEVIADALACKGISERGSSVRVEEPKAPVGSLAWRREQMQLQASVGNSELGVGW